MLSKVPSRYLASRYYYSILLYHPEGEIPEAKEAIFA